MPGVLSSWVAKGNRKCIVMKAVTDQGEVIGRACWAFAGFTYGDENKSKTEDVKEEKVEPNEESEKEEKIEEKPKTKMEELEALTSGVMNEGSARLTPPGSKCMILVASPVLPSFQSLGVGSSLIRWGTKIADEKRVYCWVSSSDKGWIAFQKNGFAEVDLDGHAG